MADADCSPEPNYQHNSKRRSINFQRRSINHCNEVLGVIDSGDDTSTESSFDLNKYISNLNQEYADWKKTLSERKSRRRHLTQVELKLGDEVEPDLTVLSHAQKVFIEARPNYAQLNKDIQNLVPIAVKIAQLNSHIDHLNKSLRISFDEKIHETAKEMTELVKE